MPNRTRQSAEKREKTLLENLDRYELYTELEPLLKSALKYGSVDQLIQKSKSIAMVELLKIMATAEKEDVKLKAVESVLNRSMGKPVERKVSLYGDLETMNEKDIDRQIKQLMSELGPSAVIDVIADQAASKQLPTKRGVDGESGAEGGVTSSTEDEAAS